MAMRGRCSNVVTPGSRCCGRIILLVAFGLCGETTAQASADTCFAAGVARAGFRSREAVRWLNIENEKRAPYYLKAAKRMYIKGLKQRDKIDKSNDDPFIALYDGKHQILAALDLAPSNASIWLGAGQAMAMIASIDEEGGSTDQMYGLFARACSLDVRNIDKVLKWSSKQAKAEDKDLTKLKRDISQTIQSWRGNVPTNVIPDFLPFLRERDEMDICAQGSSMDEVQVNDVTLKVGQNHLQSALAAMTVKPIFPTLITTVNVAEHFGKDFSSKLAAIAIEKYEAFSKDLRRRGKTDPNDINDAFFGAQETGEGREKSQKAQHFWPELYNSEEYKMLQRFMKGALLEHAKKTGYGLSEEQEKKTSTVLWGAVYLSDGGRHGYHVHQGSLSSCVFYAKAPAGKTPIMFIDPRGAPPTHDYEQHIGERDFEPVAPFHHNYHFFAEAGDLVCFPSWLVHRVPSHFEDEARVAFPANLQATRAWDAWYRSATLA